MRLFIAFLGVVVFFGCGKPLFQSKYTPGKDPNSQSELGIGTEPTDSNSEDSTGNTLPIESPLPTDGTSTDTDLTTDTQTSTDSATTTDTNTSTDPNSDSSTASETNTSTGTDVTTEPEESKYDKTFATGLDSCVADGLAEREIDKVFVERYSRTLSDFADQDRIGSLAEFNVLADLILRDIVNAGGLIDYQKLRTNLSQQWQLIRNAIPLLPLPDVNQHEAAMAFWVNTYNLVMIDFLVDLPDATTVPLDLFTQAKSIAGKSLTLNQIEKGILGMGGRPASPENEVPQELLLPTIEPRLHFALVCGAVSCPKLRNFLYTAENINAVMQENTYMFANDSEKHIRLDPFEGVNYVVYNELIFWYQDDFKQMFGENYAGITDYMFAGCRTDIDVIRDVLSNQPDLAYEDTYDWTVNKQ